MKTPKINANLGSVVSELNRKAAEMLADGKITQRQHDEIVTENIRQQRSNIMRYGDYGNAKEDIKTLWDILHRQGNKMLIDVMAEHVGKYCAKYDLGSSDRAMTKISILDELEDAINERI